MGLLVPMKPRPMGSIHPCLLPKLSSYPFPVLGPSPLLGSLLSPCHPIPTHAIPSQPVPCHAMPCHPIPAPLPGRDNAFTSCSVFPGQPGHSWPPRGSCEYGPPPREPHAPEGPLLTLIPFQGPRGTMGHPGPKGEKGEPVGAGQRATGGHLIPSTSQVWHWGEPWQGAWWH